MKIIVLDCTLPILTLALVENGQIVWQVRDCEAKPSNRVHEHLRVGLSAVNWQISDVSRVILTRGPGSFTGIRVGLAAVRGLQAGLGQLQVKTCTTFGALALAYWAKVGNLGQTVAVAIDSLGVEVLVQLFKDGKAVGEPMCLTPEVDDVPAADAWIGNGCAKLGVDGTDVEIDSLAILDVDEEDLQPLYVKPLSYRKVTAA